MNFTHTDDRRMIADSLRRYLTEQYPIEARNAVAYTAPFHDPGKWQELADLGIVGALVSEAHGGFGGHGFDIAIVFEELGRALCPEPMLANLMSLRLLAASGASDLLTEVAGGASRCAFAVFEPDNSDTLADIHTRASKEGGSWRLNGRKSVVYGAPAASVMLVAAATAAGVGLFVTREAEVLPYAMIDGGGAAEVVCNGTPAECLSEDAAAAIEAALDAGRLALCAEAVGAMDVLLAMTLDYLQQRRQFGQAIAQFQALQHRVVDMAVELEQARSIVILAASSLDSNDGARHVAMAKNLVGRTATLVAEESVQLHGGIGMTWEYPGSHYSKRLVMLDHQLGDRHQHLTRLVRNTA